MASIHPQLEEIETELERASASAHALTESVDDDRFVTRPSEGAWSIAECLAHLTLTTHAYLPIIDDALARPATDAGDPSRPFKADIAGRLLRWTIEPPYRMRVKTLAPFVPSSAAGRDEVLRAFDASQEQLLQRVRAANGHALDKIRIVSPFSGNVKYNLYACFRILPAHQRRHLWQAERAKEQIERARVRGAAP